MISKKFIASIMLEKNAGYYQTCRGPLPVYLSSNIIYKNGVNKSKKTLRSLSCNYRRRQQLNLSSTSITYTRYYVLHQGNNYLYSSIPYCKLVMQDGIDLTNIYIQTRGWKISNPKNIRTERGFPVHKVNLVQIKIKMHLSWLLLFFILYPLSVKKQRNCLGPCE